MTYPTPEMVVSGVPYTVVAVAGGAEPSLDAVAQSREFTVEGRTGRHVVTGEGLLVDGAVRFHEKSEHGVGKDVRVWQVVRTDDGTLCAEAV